MMADQAADELKSTWWSDGERITDLPAYLASAPHGAVVTEGEGSAVRVHVVMHPWFVVAPCRAEEVDGWVRQRRDAKARFGSEDKPDGLLLASQIDMILGGRAEDGAEWRRSNGTVIVTGASATGIITRTGSRPSGRASEKLFLTTFV